ncbi:MAG: alpha-amylase [Bacteroidales bacterium]|nr:alpha-amylase [Bacteroidales bacterium]
MMRKLIPLLPLVAAFFLTVSCDPTKKNDPETQDTLTVSPSSLDFEAEDASTKFVSITTEKDWTATPSNPWIHLEKTSGTGRGTLAVTVDANTGEDRSGSITVKGSKTETVSVTQKGKNIVAIVANPDPFDGNKRSSTTYQLLIYSFADSDGNGIGDFKGIQNRLDYLDGLGATALWLSPAHPTPSYHAYDVNDYSTVNPLYGSEQDFKNLIDAAHDRGIKIYMDYVLNHSGTGTTWFKDALANPDSPYRDYYVFSDDPSADVAAGRVDNYAGSKKPGMGDWHSVSTGNKGYKGRLHFKVDWTGTEKTVTVTETDDRAMPSNSAAKMWIFVGNVGNVGLYESSDNVFEITADVDTEWGFLVRTSSTSWDGGTKWGGTGKPITLGQPFTLNNSTAADIIFGGATTYYFASFATSMPDLNYGKYTECENSPAFQDIAATADKWINLGVDGFRLDAVLWIYQAQIKANQRFLDQWYQRLNATYKAAGHTDDIFMVGEAWEGHGVEKQYYKGLPSCFEFEYFDVLKQALGGNAANYVNAVNGFISDHTAERPDAITSIFMSNHDENRAAEELGRNVTKEKQAAAMMLTTPGKPFIYQGEELGYYGKKDGGDEYVRTPILWDKAGKDCAKKGVDNKVDSGMLKSEISVEAQEADANSLLNVYKTWSRLRNTYPALAEGTMTAAPGNGGSIAAWYMTSGSQKMLVIHNTAASEKTVKVTDDVSRPVALLGAATLDHDTLTLSGNTSVVFKL